MCVCIITDKVGSLQGAKDAPAPRPNKRLRLGPAHDETAATPAAHSKATKPNLSVEGKKGVHHELAEQFMQVMQPRSKKGPSWKDDDPAAVASGSILVDASSKSTKSRKGKEKVDPTGEDDTAASQDPDAVTDLDWLRRHTTQSAAVAAEKAFEQSDDEPMEADGDEEVDVCAIFLLRAMA